MNNPEILYMVVPCYNEQEVLRETAAQLKTKYNDLMSAGLISKDSRVVFVNDGSKDSTWDIIRELHEVSPNLFSGIDLAHNSGHQNAVLAGLMTVKELCDMCITMDADLQDDIDTIDEMVKQYYEGNQVVYGVRSARDTDTFFKKFTPEPTAFVMLLSMTDPPRVLSYWLIRFFLTALEKSSVPSFAIAFFAACIESNNPCTVCIP